jgi:NADPH:quinone reductase
VMGKDFAGTLSAFGPGSDGNFAIGERVAGIASRFGSFAESTLIDLREGEVLAKVPSTVGDDVAAALPSEGLAAVAALEVLAPNPKKTLLIVGATGAVGSLTLQLATKLGAHIIAAVKRSPGDAWALGASAVIVTSEIDVLHGVRLTHPQGVDGVLDLVGKTSGEAYGLVDALRPGGVFVSASCVADVSAFACAGVTALNLTRRCTRRNGREKLERLLSLVATGRLTLSIAREVALSELPYVVSHGRASSVTGKTLVKVAARP